MEGFDEEIKVYIPDRGESFFVRVAGRDLATSNGIALVLHGVSAGKRVCQNPLLQLCHPETFLSCDKQLCRYT